MKNNKIDNIANITYNYKVNPNEANQKEYSKNTNIVDVKVNHAQINEVLKSSNIKYSYVGDIVTYSVSFTNIGNTSAINVIITDTIPSNMSLIEDSITSNVLFELISSDFKLRLLNGVKPDEVITINFKAKVNSMPSSKIIENAASVIYEYIYDPNLEPKTNKQVSNKSIINVVSENVSITKYCENENVSDNDEIIFRFIIKNNNNKQIENIKFYDNLMEELVFIDGSFIGSVNTVVANDLINGVNLGIIDAFESKEISFRAKVINNKYKSTLSNFATIEYEINFENNDIKKSNVKSNICIIKVNYCSFKQVIKSDLICIGEQIRDIISVNVNPNIIHYEIIESPKGISKSNQILTGKKLIVYGYLCTMINYDYNHECSSINNKYVEIPICEYLVLPSDMSDICDIDIDIIIENICYKKIEDSKILLSVSYLIKDCK